MSDSFIIGPESISAPISVSKVSPSLTRIPGLDGIRALAILMVLLAHSDLTREFTGGTGVSVFFFLSGYLITTLLQRERSRSGRISVREFYIRRFFRIFPPLYLLIALGILFSVTGLTTGLVDFKGIASAALFYGNYFMLNPHDWPSGFGVLWSLAVEEHFYLVFPLLFIYMQRWSKRGQITLLAALCALVLAWRFLVIALGYGTSHLYLATDARFDGILFGCILAIALDPLSHQPKLFWKRFQAQLAIAGVFGTLFWEHIPHIKGPLAYTLTSLSLMPVFGYIVTNSAQAAVRFLESRLLVRIGVLSYSLYLFHMLCVSVFVRHTHLGGPMRMLLALPICYVIALLVEHFVDRPAQRLRQGIIRKWSYHPPSADPTPEQHRLLPSNA